MAHYKQEHGNVPASRLRKSIGNLSACLLFLATNLRDHNTTSFYVLLRYTQRHHADNMLDITFLWGMSSSTLDLVFLQCHQMPTPQLGTPLTILQSVACLLHWQVLLALAAHLSIEGQDELCHYMVRSAFSHTDYLSDAHFHMHWLVKERLPNQTNRSVDLESVRQTFSSQEPSAIPLGKSVDSCLLEPSHLLPSTRATNLSVLLAFEAHPSTVGKWDAGKRPEAIQELQARVLESTGQVIAIGEIGIGLSLHKCNSTFEGQQVQFLQEFVSTVQKHPALRSRPLMLHIWDRTSKFQTAHTLCLEALLEVRLPEDHKLYWH